MDILNNKGVKFQEIKGVRYVYEDTPYWDKAKKQNRHERKYIGKLDGDGSFIPNKFFLSRQIETEGDDKEKANKPPIARRMFFGAGHLLDRIGEQTGLAQDLDSVFGKAVSGMIQSLAYFLVIENESSMYRFGRFSKTCRHPWGENIPSQRVSEIFSGISEGDKLSFFKLRAARCLKEEYLAYDTTSISSYSEAIKSVKYGKNKDLEKLPQINLAIAFGDKSMTPVYYRKLPGNIGDVSTIRKLLGDMASIGVKKAKFVLDRGFYSKDNFDNIYRKGYKFVAACKANTNIFKELMSEVREPIKDFRNYNDSQGVYALSKSSFWTYEHKGRSGSKVVKKKINYFAYYDGERAEREKVDFIKDLKSAEASYLSGEMTKGERELMEAFFHTTETTGGRIVERHNQEAIDKHLGTFGYFMLMSDHVTDAHQALEIYRNKDVVEKAFFNVKHRLDMKRAKVSTEGSLDGKLFVQFVALSYISRIHQVMTENDLYKDYSISTMLDELYVIESFRYPGKKTHYSEITKKQHEILSCFDASIDTTL